MPWWKEAGIFIYKQARSCIFAGLFFLLLFFSQHIPFLGILRYDRIFLGALLIQGILFATKIETLDEVKMIFLFHFIGLGMELFKTHPAIGAWRYPEPAIFKIAAVPLYSGFMYASVASYMSQAWKHLKLKLVNYPPYIVTIPLIVAVYANFFTHHFLPDIRWILTGLIFLAFINTRVLFTVTNRERSMPVILSFVLIGFVIWIAENIATFLGAWQYPNQTGGWHLVHPEKISSWFLFAIISFIIVADLKHFKARGK